VADQDEQSARQCAKNDYAHDCKGSEGLTRETFGDALFELADTWTSGIDAAEYAQFLLDLLHKLKLPARKGSLNSVLWHSKSGGGDVQYGGRGRGNRGGRLDCTELNSSSRASDDRTGAAPKTKAAKGPRIDDDRNKAGDALSVSRSARCKAGELAPSMRPSAASHAPSLYKVTDVNAWWAVQPWLPVGIPPGESIVERMDWGVNVSSLSKDCTHPWRPAGVANAWTLIEPMTEWVDPRGSSLISSMMRPGVRSVVEAKLPLPEEARNRWRRLGQRVCARQAANLRKWDTAIAELLRMRMVFHDRRLKDDLRPILPAHASRTVLSPNVIDMSAHLKPLGTIPIGRKYCLRTHAACGTHVVARNNNAQRVCLVQH